MDSTFKQDKDFEASIGKFVIEFSKLEFALAELASWTSEDIHERDKLFRDCLRDNMVKNRQRISEYVKSYLPAILSEWTAINDSIGKLNKERRFLVHGMIDHSEFKGNNTAILVNKNSPETKTFDSDAIKTSINKIWDVLTGENGVNGEFYLRFVTLRIDKHNDLISKGKIVYKVNNEVLTEWKGK